MIDKDARMQILEMIESGRISAEEGLGLLQALADSGESAEPEEFNRAPGPAVEEEAIDLGASASLAESVATVDEAPSDSHVDLGSTPQEEEPLRSPDARFSSASGARAEEAALPTGDGLPGELPANALKWRRWWVIPLWIGAGVTVLGGVLMYWAMQASGMGFWFVCASLFFALGVIILALAVQTRTSPWLHLRVQQAPGERPERIAFSFPILVRPTAWFLRTFGRFIPQLDRTSLDEVILAIGETTNADNPIYIQVDDDEDGEKVEIYIG